MPAASLPVLWANCVERLKDRVSSRPFWEALELTTPIIIEDNVLIIGLDAANFNRAAYVNQPANMRSVKETVEEMFHQPLEVRIIEGSTLADWETTRERDVRIAAMRQTGAEHATAVSTALDSWEAIHETVSRLYARMPNRSLPQGKARYVSEALYAVVDAMQDLYTDQPDETAERGLARVIERIATSADMSPSTVAFELERLRAWRQNESG